MLCSHMATKHLKGWVKENNVDYNDDEYEDIGKVRELKIGQEDEENED